MPDDENPDPFGAQKEVEYYAAMVTAWFTTRIELDKSLLTLSAGGIGLMISLVTVFGIQSIESLLLFILALAAFICCIVAVLVILKRNSKHIEEVFRQNKATDPLLGILDSVAIVSFLSGVVLSVIIGVAGAITSLESKRTQTQMPTKTVSGFANDSVNGLINMKPGQGDFGRSFNGAANLAPTAQPPVNPAAQSAQPQPAPATAPTPSTDVKGK
jgi:hypothetical protein